jgi:hypothetical protein
MRGRSTLAVTSAAARQASTKNTAAHQKQLQISLYVLGGEMRRRQTVADIIDYPRGRPILGAMGNLLTAEWQTFE